MSHSHAQKVVAAAQRLMDADKAGTRRPAPPPYHKPVALEAALSNILIATRHMDPDHWTPEQQEQEDSLSIVKFEQDIWQEYGLTGDFDPEYLLKECQTRAREAEQCGDKTLLESTMLVLNALNTIHKMRKQLSRSFAQGQEGIWRDVGEAAPNGKLKAVGQRFWAVLIGNDKYNTEKELYGCINDTELIRDYLLHHLGVPNDRVYLLHNASRAAIINALYDLRDNIHIQFGDNIFVHFSGHGSSYDAQSFFSTGVSSVGSIEAICPSDRGSTTWKTPDISDRELNLILSEVRDAKGGNITFIADCCYSDGMAHSTDGVSTRFVKPIRLGHPEPSSSLENQKGDVSSFDQLAACQGFQQAREVTENDDDHEPLFDDDHSSRGALPTAGYDGRISMLRAADRHPRRKSSVSASSKNWKGDVSALVHLSACQHFQQAREVTHDGRTYGAFTWALVKVLKSAQSQGQTYTGIIQMIGRVNDQIPKAVGDQKESRLWFQ